jgi:hypothetical protein
MSGWRRLCLVEGMTDRLRRRIQSDFTSPGSADEVIRLVAAASDSERVQAAIVLFSAGDESLVRDGVALAATDWRDVLMRAGLESEQWPDRLHDALGA